MLKKAIRFINSVVEFFSQLEDEDAELMSPPVGKKLKTFEMNIKY